MSELMMGSSRESMWNVSDSMVRRSGTKRSEKIRVRLKNSTISKDCLKNFEKSATLLSAGRTNMMIRRSVDMLSRKNRNSSANEKSKRMGTKRAKKKMFARKIHVEKEGFIR